MTRVKLEGTWASALGGLLTLLSLSAFCSEPSIDISRDKDKATITFSGTLFAAQSAEGPWHAVTNATSPYHSDTTETQKFFLVSAPLTNSIFSGEAIAAFTLTGPLQAHFDLAHAGTPDGIFPPKREKPYFDGTLTMPGLTLPITMRVRGNSSLQECPFPKIKFKVSKENRPGTPFAEAREIKIGTHCADGGRGNIGRLRDQVAAFREALAYETLQTAGFIAPQVRRASIRYQDATPPTNGTEIVGWSVVREGMVLEDIEVVAQRLNGRVLSDIEVSSLPEAPFDFQLTTDLRLFNAMIGNWDFSLGTEGRSIWNVDVLELFDGTKTNLIPVAGDFDLASFVTGIVRRSSPSDYHPELGSIEREVLYQLEQIQKSSEPGNFTTARERFTAKREALESHLFSAKVDEEGRLNALRHLAAFYTALEQFR